MYTLIARLCAIACLALQVACAVVSSKTPSALDTAPPAPPIQQRTSKGQINKERAIALANADAARTHQTLGSFKVMACERARLWVVIYDNGGPEYYIDKTSGATVLVQQLPEKLSGESTTRESIAGRVITEAEAVEISRKNFIDFLLSQGDRSDQVGDYDAVACELANTWRVFFEYRAAPGQSLAHLPNTNPPNYMIDKRSGEIIYTTHRITN